MNKKEYSNVRNYLDKDYVLDRIKKEGTCWIWQLRKNNKNQGVSSLNLGGAGKRTYLAHRLSYQLFVGEINLGNITYHTCGNNSCVNPAHIKQGTIKEKNKYQRDHKIMVKKPPTQYGNNYTGVKVLAGGLIFNSLTEAGKHFNVSDNGIKLRIKKGKDGYRYL